MTGTMARVDAGTVALMGSDRRGHQLIAKANIYASGTMVPTEMQNKPDMVLAGMLTCLRLGFSEDSVTALYVMPGDQLEPPAHMYLGAVHQAGFDTDWVRTDNEAAVIEISRPGKRPLQIGFTIDDARIAGLLDEWVEKWQTTQGGKRYCEKFVLNRPGVETPDWVANEVRQGRIKRMDNWHKWPADMLASKAAKRAVRRMAPEVLYGIAAEIRAATHGTVTLADDDEPVDGEIVDSNASHAAPAPPGPGAAERASDGPGLAPSFAPARPGGDVDAGTQGYPPGPGSASASFAGDAQKRTLLRLIASLTDGERDLLRAAFQAETIPPVKSGVFTVDHLGRVLALIDDIWADSPDETEAGVRGSAPAAVVGAAGESPQAEPAATYANPDDDGRPFE